MSPGELTHEPAIPVGKAAATVIPWKYKGELRMTAIVKATFAFVADAAMARVEPQAILREDVGHDNNPARSVRFATDLVPFLKRADVLFTGYAYAPGGAPVERMSVRLGVFDGERPRLAKTLHVQKKGGFRKLALTYENAFGGIGYPDNPLGVGAVAGEEAPRVVDPLDPRRAAGFAPISRVLAARRRLLGAFAAPSFGRSIVEIPDGFDWDYFQAAPADQRIDYLRGDEWIVLAGLHPELPVARTRLPGARAAARIHGLSRFGVEEGKALAMSADTLRVSGDEQRCTVTWRGTFPVAGLAVLAAARVVVGVEAAGEPIAWPDEVALERAMASGAPLSEPASGGGHDATISLDDSDLEAVSSSGGGARDTLPIPSSVARALVASAPRIEDAPAPAAPKAGAAAATLPIPSRAAKSPASPALPFQPGSPDTPPAAAQPSPKRRPRGDAGATLPIPSRAARQRPATLPFKQKKAPLEPQEENSQGGGETGRKISENLPASPPPCEISQLESAPPVNELPVKAPPVKEAGASPWAPAPPAAEPTPKPPPPKKLPPKVDVKNKLYGSKKKG